MPSLFHVLSNIIFALSCCSPANAAKASKASSAPRSTGSAGTRGRSPTCDAKSSESGCPPHPVKGGGPMSMFKDMRRLISSAGGVFARKSLELRTLPGGLGVFMRKHAWKGDVLMEVPLSRVLWRETADLQSLQVDLPPGSLLSEAERLILFSAILRRKASLNLDAGIFSGYAQSLLQRPLPNSTVFWDIAELEWFRQTDAHELTQHFLSRVSHIHSAAPLAVSTEDIKASFAHYHLRHFRLWLGGAPFSADRLDIAMVPGVDFCRHREGGAKVVFNVKRRAVQLLASSALQAGEEIFVDFGSRDITDFLIAGEGALINWNAEALHEGVFLPVPLDNDANGRMKGELLETLQWPAEVRLMPNETRDLRVLRLAVMPLEEFSAWSVGALAAGAPLAVSRAFRTEVQVMAFLATDCARRSSAVSASAPPSAGVNEANTHALALDRLTLALSYRRFLLDIYGSCTDRAKDKLVRLRKWAQRRHVWTQQYVDEAIWKTTASGSAPSDRIEEQLLSLEPPSHVDSENIDQRLSYSSIVALVNSKAREFLRYFTELLRAPVVTVPGFVDVSKRLMKIKRLAAAIVQLKGPACGAVDLSAFAWINELHGEEEVFTTLRYLLPEMDGLVKEFAELIPQGDFVPFWR